MLDALAVWGFISDARVAGTWHNVSGQIGTLLQRSHHLYRSILFLLIPTDTMVTLSYVYRPHWSGEPILPTILGEIVVDQREDEDSAQDNHGVVHVSHPNPRGRRE